MKRLDKEHMQLQKQENDAYLRRNNWIMLIQFDVPKDQSVQKNDPIYTMKTVKFADGKI